MVQIPLKIEVAMQRNSQIIFTGFKDSKIQHFATLKTLDIV